MNCNTKNCVPYEEYIRVTKLAEAYVPFQKLCNLFDVEEGLVKGTIFPELASPYCKWDSKKIREENPCGNQKSCNPCENRPAPFMMFR